MRALVTGGAGFIGSHIAHALIARGDQVCVVDNLSPKVHGNTGPNLPDGVEFILGDILIESTLGKALATPVDIVFHEAATVGFGKGGRDAESYIATNMAGTARLMQKLSEQPIRLRPRVVLASTMAIYGEGSYVCDSCKEPREARRDPADLVEHRWDPLCEVCGQALTSRPVTERHPAQPGTVYAITKLGQEFLCMTLGRELDIPVVALRYHNVYGPRMPRDTPYAGVASLFKSRLLAGLPPIVYEDGAQLRDFIHVEDIAQANLLASDARLEAVAFESFNVGTGRPHRILDFAIELAKTLAPSLEPKFPGTFRLGDVRHVYADTSKIERLGFKPRVPFEEGVSRFAKETTREAPREAA